MKKSILFLSLILALSIFHSRTLQAGHNPGLNPENEWQLKEEAQGIKFFVKIESCAGSAEQYFQLRIENTTANAVKVNFSLVPMDLPASAPVHGVVENLAAGASVEASCTDSNDKMKVVMLPPATSISDLLLLYHIE